MSHPKFVTSSIKKKQSEPEKERFILFKPVNPIKDNSSLSQKIPQNLISQSIEKKELGLNNNMDTNLLINSANNNINNNTPIYPNLINNSNNISYSKFIFI